MPANPSAIDQQAVLDADDRRRAATAANDADALEGLLTEDFTYVHNTGVREGRDAYLARIRNAYVQYIALDRGAATVRLYGDVAAVDGEASMTYRLPDAPSPKTIRNLYLAVWVRAGRTWRMAAYASTLTPAA